MTRDELIARTRQLIAEGERLDAQPSLGALQLWRGTRLVATWEVPPRWFAGGIGFVQPGGRIALFGIDGGLAAVYDRQGNQVGFD